MTDFSVCIECFWPEMAHADRVRRAASLGFRWIEFWGWSNKDLPAIAAACAESNVRVTTFCIEVPTPLVEPQSASELLAGAEKSIAAARSIGCEMLIVCCGDVRPGETFELTRRTVVRNLKTIAPLFEQANITLVIEPLNDRVDHKGHWLTRMADAADIAREVGSPRVKLLMDLYHQQITEGDLISRFRAHADLIAHVHCAGVPGRHEPDTCEVDYRQVFAAIGATGYNRRVGLEFWPTVASDEALRRARGLSPAMAAR